MITTHNLGFPRIGKLRELKFALEKYWKDASELPALELQAKHLRAQNWEAQAKCDLVPVGDFSYYDQVLDMSFLLGNIPERAGDKNEKELDRYFRMARGRSASDNECGCTHAGEMTKWFDTNYHYIVPELTKQTRFALNPNKLLAECEQAKALGVNTKPVIIGPVTYLWLSKTKDDTNPLDYLESLLPIYCELLALLNKKGIKWVQIDEPILVTELSQQWQNALEMAYHRLNSSNINLLITTYFGQLKENLQLACRLPSAGLHLDAVNAKHEIEAVLDWLPAHKILSLGVINGRNIWKTDLGATLDWLEPIAKKLSHRLWLAPSCSLLHVPIDLCSEKKLQEDIKSWLSFAYQKLDELNVLKVALNEGRDQVRSFLENNAAAILSRKKSKKVHNTEIKQAVKDITLAYGKRKSDYAVRAKIQKERLNLPLFPTTTIGSFPQTNEIRKARLQFKNAELDTTSYTNKMKNEIQRSVNEQEALGLDVFVHGEPERNDMVEYFGEQLNGYAFSDAGWVQSYGSRCVKPPILFGDISLSKNMTVDWTAYAQSLTKKPMKGMLTGPVTILNWSFVRDDQPRSETCYQLALAIRKEVLSLEKSGVKIIQIDEAALREGLPLRQSQWQEYLNWAVESFRICANGVQDETQIHTHMCYSEFNDIIDAIARMDADVITIETSRSDMELLDVFDEFNYPNEIGPGVYDIHSPNIPKTQDVIDLINKAAQRVPKDRLWINPDCGLKTRQWDEVLPALKNMVLAAKKLRETAEV